MDVKQHSDSSIVHRNHDLSEHEIETKMKSLPHWKFGAAFENYMDDWKLVDDETKQEFMDLYKKNKYFKMYQVLIKNSSFKKYFDSFVIAAGVEDKSPEHRDRRTKKEKELASSRSLELKPYYLDKDRVRSRLFGEIQSERVDVDWKNLEKLTKDAISSAGLNIFRLVSLKNVLENEIVRLKKQDEKYESQITKVNILLSCIHTNSLIEND